jgi:hypothetical protein
MPGELRQNETDPETVAPAKRAAFYPAATKESKIEGSADRKRVKDQQFRRQKQQEYHSHELRKFFLYVFIPFVAILTAFWFSKTISHIFLNVMATLRSP